MSQPLIFPRFDVAFAAKLLLIALISSTICVTPQVVWAAAFNGGRFIEKEGWQAQIEVDCLLKGQRCGRFRYITQACEGELVFIEEKEDRFVFRAELRSGRCLPGCNLELNRDFSRYTEVCRSSSGQDMHEGKLSAASVEVLPTPTPVAVSTHEALPSTPAPAEPPPAASLPSATNAPPPPPAALPPSTTSPYPERSDRRDDTQLRGNYTFDPKTGLITGSITINWDNGNRFEGTLIDGKRHGRGKFTWQNGQVYDGDWQNDRPDGTATIIFPDGERYDGPVLDGKPQGKGVRKYSQGDTYEGDFVDGAPHGQGRLRDATGNVYEGTWRTGQRAGQGRFTWANGQYYVGDWQANTPNGRGTLRYANGDHYEGPMVNGLPEGKGIKTFAASQDRYEGLFKRGEADGEGLYYGKNGDVYDGEWQAGKKHGYGRYTWPNGDYWEGEFNQDKQTEEGRLFMTTTIDVSGADVEKLVRQSSTIAGENAPANKPSPTDKRAELSIDTAKLLSIPMVAKEVSECKRRTPTTNCEERVSASVLADTQFVHKWQIMSNERDKKGKTTVFEVDSNAILVAGNVFSWMRSGDGSTSRSIGVKYDCRTQNLQVQLVYNCSKDANSAGCVLDPNLDKYAGRSIPATDIKHWFKSACEHP